MNKVFREFRVFRSKKYFFGCGFVALCNPWLKIFLTIS